MIYRHAEKTIQELIKGFPVIAVTGPRQSGKTTLVKKVFPEKPYVSFDEIDKVELAESDPKGFLNKFPSGAIFDEVQNCPKLFSYIQPIVDNSKSMGQFILTGSQQYGLFSEITQSLAGRVGIIKLLPFQFNELQINNSLDEIIYQGLYPVFYDRDVKPEHWFTSYVTTYIERDIRKILAIQDLSNFQKFLKLCAARTGQLLNLSDIANQCGITHNTAKSWISVLEASYIVFLLYPHFNNFGKRLVKTPKIYFHDTGLACWLMSIQDANHVNIHPQRGALFENLIISEFIKNRFNKGLASNLYFWRDRAGNEIDLLVDNGTALIPIEIKSGATYSKEFKKNLIKWDKISKQSEKKYTIYGGNEDFVDMDTEVLSWKSVKKIL